MVWLSFFFCHCVFLLGLLLRYIFGFNLSSLLFFLQTRSLFLKLFSRKKTKQKKNSLHFHPFCCPCRHSFVTPYSYYLCDFWFMRASMLLCRLVVQESLVCFSSERKRDWRGAMQTSAVIGKEKKKKKKVPRCLFSHLFFWIDKDFWFRSSSFLPLAPSFTSFPPSLLFHSVYFWHRKIRREREKERGRRRCCERRGKKIKMRKRRAQERKR